MIFLSWLICLLSAYLLLKRNVFDFFSLSVVMFWVYSIPLLIGECGYEIHGQWIYENVNNIVYICYFVFILIILLMMIYYDFFIRKNRCLDLDFFNGIASITTSFLSILVFVTFIAILANNNELISGDKMYIAENFISARVYILFEFIVVFLAVISFNSKKYVSFLMILMIILWFSFIGDRTPLVFFIIIELIIMLNRRNEILSKKIFTRKIMIGLFILFMYAFVYKQIGAMVQALDISDAWDSLLHGNIFLKSIMNYEGMVTVQVFNSIASNSHQIHYNFINFFDNFISVILPINLQGNVEGFNSFFQPILFPDVGYGMANNIIAQFYILGGGCGVILFSFLFSCSVMVASYLLLSGVRVKIDGYLISEKLRLVILFCATIFSYYYFRNDFNYLINIEKRIFFIVIAIILFDYFVRVYCYEKNSSFNNKP
ncbi:oligosaccharide repeat unit polymerase [Francisella tularensis subsp. novicida]|uniref:Oligosaccharide repeat unit polymerase n=3 Tax=Francisella tularensis TaxID=263 RepID=A0A6I4RME3_FRATU|nr:O-antigen polymerase [Francisella tularensis]ABK81664.1 Wzy [Francisella tularensis subsp. novicida U112]EDX20065.1 membrane protein, putative [Francisella tularensis subsp. novicida FTE]ABK90292.1 hypothetical membrane protein [Francisella tularensis subsp. novicida U112]AJI61449.1 putative membrane protein [Francisella tularensis subsp. novicida U112]MBK2035890.1 oligosaccharide repeat unit polymerase [Francisella tularensis subsp. novicida]